MDQHGIGVGLVSVSAAPEVAARALRDHPDRFVASATADPNRGMEGVRDLVRLHEEHGLRAVSLFPHGVSPQVPIDALRMYPIYEIGRASCRESVCQYV